MYTAWKKKTILTIKIQKTWKSYLNGLLQSSQKSVQKLNKIIANTEAINTIQLTQVQKDYLTGLKLNI